jgi:hypothetical protein
MTLLEWFQTKVDGGIMSRSDWEYIKDKRVWLRSSKDPRLKFDWWIQNFHTDNSEKVIGLWCSHFTMGRQLIPTKTFRDILLDFQGDDDALDAILFKLKG